MELLQLPIHHSMFTSMSPMERILVSCGILSYLCKHKAANFPTSWLITLSGRYYLNICLFCWRSLHTLLFLYGSVGTFSFRRFLPTTICINADIPNHMCILNFQTLSPFWNFRNFKDFLFWNFRNYNQYRGSMAGSDTIYRISVD